jgi:hypothetical protein
VRRAFVTALGVAACLAATVGCSTTLHGVASPAETASAPSTPTSPAASTPGGWSPTCLVGDPCALPDSPTASGSPVCSPLPAAMVAFDDRARAEFPGGPLPTSSDRAMSRLTDLVQDVVDRCGYQVMVDVADQYPSPLYDWLRNTAVLALGRSRRSRETCAVLTCRLSASGRSKLSTTGSCTPAHHSWTRISTASRARRSGPMSISTCRPTTDRRLARTVTQTCPMDPDRARCPTGTSGVRAHRDPL